MGLRPPVDLAFKQTGQTDGQGYIERFNGKLRDACLNSHWLTSLDDALSIIEAWRCDYNEARPHRALGQLTPTDFAKRTSFSTGFLSLLVDER